MKRSVAYVVDLEAGAHRSVTVEGIGKCREHFAQLVQGMEQHNADVVVVYKAEYLFIDTSPMWIEKFIATAQRHGITVFDTSRKREYNLCTPGDEAAFRALRTA